MISFQPQREIKDYSSGSKGRQRGRTRKSGGKSVLG